MTDINPYQTPESAIEDGRISEGHDVETIAEGQKLVIYGILVNFASIPARLVWDPLGFLVAIGATVLSIWGLLKLARGMGFSTVKRVVLIVLMLVPLVNLITLLIVNSWATASLREAGYRVGLLGASRS